MRDIALNSFEDGMSLDVDELLQKANTMAYALNLRFIARDNTVYVVSNIKGNSDVSEIGNNFIPIGVASKNGIAYIISAEIVSGSATGKGQIGTYPSPAYPAKTGSLLNVYKPLQNYSGDTPAEPPVYGDFTSDNFNFTLQYDLDVELQNSYDGTVNIVITDGVNPMRIFNPGFAVLPNDQYALIEHDGINDSNQYDVDDWETSINLIQTSKKIMNLNFGGVEPGGSLKGGNYTYFFKYATQDKNETDVVEASRVVSVFRGNQISDIKGTEGDGENSEKSVVFNFSHLDESYSYIVPYFIWVSGKTAPVIQAVRIDDFITIAGDTATFIHNGTEQVTVIDEAIISDDNALIETARTITQFQGMMMAGNIRTKNTHDDDFLTFSQQIEIGSTEKSITIPDFDDFNLMRRYPNSSSISADGYNNGYYNPLNIYHRGSYMGGETYPFRIVYILPDGTSSKAYPLLGIDNKDNLDLDTIYARIDAAARGVMSNGNGYYDSDDDLILKNNMVNHNGIYRFPNREKNTNKMFDSVNGTVNINGVTFKFPSDLSTIKQKSIGCYIVRAEKKKDCISSGVIMDTVSVPDIDYFKTQDQDSLTRYQGGVYTADNSMVIPTYKHWHEYSYRYVVRDPFEGIDYLGNDTIREQGDKGTQGGVLHQKFVRGQNDDVDDFVNLFRKKKFAYLSADLWTDRERFIPRINDRDITFVNIHQQISEYRVKIAQAVHKNEADFYRGEHFSVIGAKDSVVFTSNSFNARSSWVTGFSKNKNSDGFAGGALFAAHPKRWWDDGPSTKRHFFFYTNSNFNDYVGIYLPNDEMTINLPDTRPTYTDGHTIDIVEIYDLFGQDDSADPGLNYINIYASGGQRSQATIKSAYSNGDDYLYFPITKRMYWDSTVDGADATNTLAGNLDVNDRLTSFGGDTYVGAAYRKLYYNALDADATIQDENLGNVGDPNNARTANIGPVVQFIQEADYNFLLRNENLYDENEEGERTFKPYDLSEYTYDQNEYYGRENYWREGYRIPESAAFNKGYADSIVRRYSGGINQSAPFVQENWMARVWRSNKHIPNSFQNAYRIWGGSAYQDYDASLGEIVSLKVFNNALYAIQETGIGIIPVNERIQTGQDAAGPVFLEANDVLSPYIRQISSSLGSRYKASVESTENGLYGYCEEQDTIWRIGIDGLSSTTDYNIGSYLAKNAGAWRNGTTNVYNKNVRSFYDRKNKEVVFSFKNSSGSFTLGYFEPLGVFTSFYSYIPDIMFNIFDEMYSFKNAKIWEHDVDDAERAKFYGGYFKTELHIVVNKDSIGPKVFENIQLISNNVLPEEVKFKVQGAEATVDVVHDPENIHLSNASYRDERVLMAVPIVDTVTDESMNAYYQAVRDNAKSLLESSAKMRGKAMRVEITYDTTKLLRLQSIITIYRKSFS